MTTRRTQAPDPAAPREAALPTPAPDTVLRTLARPLHHEGALRRPGEVVALTADVIAVLEPEGQFEPLTAKET